MPLSTNKKGGLNFDSMFPPGKYKCEKCHIEVKQPKIVSFGGDKGVVFKCKCGGRMKRIE